MKNAKTLFTSLGLSLCLVGTSLVANPGLIREIESLKNSLPLDDPSRPSLMLRLADLYFDRAVELGRGGGDASSLRELNRARKKSLELYQARLKGDSHHPALGGDLRWNAKFQVARLLTEMGQTQEALPLWKELSEQNQIARLRRESTLRLAEHYDQSGDATKADQYYQTAFQLCAGGDVCSYIHYRRAWLLRNKGQLEPAIEAMKQALYDSKGQIREEALRDLITFIADRPGDGEASLVYVEGLSKQLNRPELIQQLSSAFFSSGNRKAGTRVLAYQNGREPKLDSQIRLLEEYYGSRDWENFQQTLDQAASLGAQASQEEKDKVEREKILRRLTVQLDGERTTDKERKEDFQATVDLYLKLFPKSTHTMRMIDGWLASEKDAVINIKKLEGWAKDSQLALSETQRKELSQRAATLSKERHQKLAAEAQKSENHREVIKELDILLTLNPEKSKVREYTYIKARALYSLQLFDEALPLFQSLATPTAQPDKWSIQSQHLAMDILGKRKDYPALIAQAQTWTQSTLFKGAVQAKLQKEIQDMAKVEREATFQRAVAQGETPESLKTFLENCLADRFTPKSCENAKVLSIKLKDQLALIQVLRKTGAKEALAVELEASGHFAESAKLTEELQLTATADPKTYLKVALLYELGNQIIDRNRVLLTLARKLRTQKELGEIEPLVFTTYKEAGLFSRETLELPWSESNKALIANHLEEHGQKSSVTQKILLASKVTAGDAWAERVLENLNLLNKKQQTTSFYGRRSQQRFELRLKRLKTLTDTSESYFTGASPKTRVAIATLLKNAHEELANTILATPIPKELDESGVEEVKGALVKMATPFQEKATAYNELIVEQSALMAQTKTAAPEEKTAPVVVVQEEGKLPQVITELKADDLKAYMNDLHRDPANRPALEGVKQYYKQKGNVRLAAYFEGRIRQLKEGETL